MKFALKADAVWFVAPANSPVFGACHDAVVAFEADAFHHDLSSGWCVTCSAGRTRCGVLA
jgi:hypothetical protein